MSDFDNFTRAEEEGRYVKKPVVVRAKRLTECVFIPTLEGVMRGEPGDWLIEGVRGEVYPCNPDIFEATYETVEEFPYGQQCCEHRDNQSDEQSQQAIHTRMVPRL